MRETKEISAWTCDRLAELYRDLGKLKNRPDLTKSEIMERAQKIRMMISATVEVEFGGVRYVS